jgi:hypothetical protein
MPVQNCDDLVSHENTSPDVPADESTHAGLSELVALAKQAFEEKRRKGCMALTSAILKIDPQNNDAKHIQSLVQTDLQQDIKQAFAFMRDARTRVDLTAYQRARELLDNVLDIDPSIEDAKILLSRLGLVLRDDSAVSSDSPGTPVIRRDPSLSPGSSNASAAQRVAAVHSETARRPDDQALEPAVPELPHRRLFTAILIGSMVWLGVTIAIVIAWKLEWWEKSRVVSATTASAVSPADSTGSHEIPADEGPRVLLDGQDAGTASIAGLQPKTGDFGSASVGQEKVGFAKDVVASNSMAASMGRIELLVLPSYAQIQIDGGPAVSLPPYLDLAAGKHQLTFTASGFEPQTVSVLLPSGGRQNVSAVLAPTMTPALKLDSKPPTS